MQTSNKLNLNETSVVTKPYLDAEIRQFKAIVRHIMKYEAEQTAAKWFRSDTMGEAEKTL